MTRAQSSAWPRSIPCRRLQNVYEITAKGDTFTVTLNGLKTVDDAKDAKHANGRIALQHGLGLKDDKGVANDKGVVKFRKVEIRPL